ncbi:hypothetical protein GT3570_11515 [Geobacillus thermoleovorans]|uniref:hypothetical protein n=1 Tax=Geobacillus thermoleovorans TaxID=33941 RepID=UPI00078CB7D7|nr:hypothetical protein GT3570_11515 [Geobacillus thermoleovorans]
MFEKITKKIDPTILVFILSGLGYAITYLYQLGVYHFYQIPSFLMDIDLTKIIRNVLFVSIIFVVGYVIDAFYKESDLKNYLVKNIVEKIKIIEMPKSLSNILQFICVVCSLYFLSKYLSSDLKNPTYLILWIVSQLGYFITKRYGQAALVLFIIFIFAYVYYLGYSQASTKDTYLMIKGTNQIVVEVNKDEAILMKIDKHKKIIYPEYQILKLESSKVNQLKLETVKTGRLTVKD